MGTTLATYSAFRCVLFPRIRFRNRLQSSHGPHRLLKHALELQKPVLFVNVGPTRADGLPGVEKLDVPSGLVMRDVVKAVV